MKNNKLHWVTIPVIVACVMIKIPLWALLFVVWPALIIILTCLTFRYSFRSDLRIEPIPAEKYLDRVREIESAEWELHWLGFERTDQFYLDMATDVITYVYRHQQQPVYLCIYHFGVKKACDLVTYFKDDLTLTTCSHVDGGMSPRPKNKLLQIFEGASYAQLFETHNSAIEFMTRHGRVPVEMPSVSFRERFLNSIREFAEMARKTFLWPIKSIYWTVTKQGKKYARSIEEQYRLGMVQMR